MRTFRGTHSIRSCVTLRFVTLTRERVVEFLSWLATLGHHTDLAAKDKSLTRMETCMTCFSTNPTSEQAMSGQPPGGNESFFGIDGLQGDPEEVTRHRFKSTETLCVHMAQIVGEKTSAP